MKPKILVSACLGFCHCRYDGSKLKSELVEMLKDAVIFETVCPEMGIGLPSPREAIRIATQKGNSRLVGSYSGLDYTEQMIRFTETFLDTFDAPSYDGVILKCKSPTCGIKDVKHYGSHGKVPSLMTKTHGFFGGAIKARVTSLIVEDEGRLLNEEIREHFLTSVSLHYAFKNVKASDNVSGALVNFHANNKYLLMAYNQSALKRMGQIVANHEKLPISDVVSNYEKVLHVIYSSQLRPGKNVNMLQHLFGYFKKGLSTEEKAFFMEHLELYKKGLISLNSLLLILKSWVVRFDEPYLKDQTIFKRYPF